MIVKHPLDTNIKVVFIRRFTRNGETFTFGPFYEDEGGNIIREITPPGATESNLDASQAKYFDGILQARHLLNEATEVYKRNTILRPGTSNAYRHSIIEFLCTAGFDWNEMPFYNSEGDIGTPQYRNFLDKMPCYAKFVKSQMGGNYGPGDLYICVDKDTVKTFQYYGDTSASIKTIGEYDTLHELSNLIERLEAAHKEST